MSTDAANIKFSNCVHRSDACVGDVNEVEVRGSKHFLCYRCQSVLQEKLNKAESDGMPGWWMTAVICKFVGKVNTEELNGTSFLPGY